MNRPVRFSAGLGVVDEELNLCDVSVANPAVAESTVSPYIKKNIDVASRYYLTVATKSAFE